MSTVARQKKRRGRGRAALNTISENTERARKTARAPRSQPPTSIQERGEEMDEEESENNDNDEINQEEMISIFDNIQIAKGYWRNLVGSVLL